MDAACTQADSACNQPRAGTVKKVTGVTLAAACAACLVVGYAVASVPQFDPLHPFSPYPNRPVLRLLSRVAKLGLWVAAFCDPPPDQDQYVRACGTDDSLCHVQGW
jgi:hypothetical protein